MFVKCERFDPYAKTNPDPRAIQYRSYEFGAALGRFLWPLEHYIYAMRGYGKTLPTTRIIGKGLSSTGRAELLRCKYTSFDDPVVFSLDASRFDLHVSEDLLKIEHSIYKHMCNDPELSRLLRMQLRNVGRGPFLEKYGLVGGRMSGDMNTALGNCILMVIMCVAYMSSRLPGVRYELMDDGDDCLLILEREHELHVMNTIKSAFLEFGMELKVEGVFYEFESIEWCQCKPIFACGEWKMVRDPIKVTSGAAWGAEIYPLRRGS